MTTINISLPDKLKEAADGLVGEGYYASFSDLVRHSLRKTVSEQIYDQWADEAKKDLRASKTKSLKTPEEIEKFVSTL